MEGILGAGGALRGRPTLSLPLAPVDLIAAREFLPDLPADRPAAGVCGVRWISAAPLRQWEAGRSTLETTCAGLRSRRVACCSKTPTACSGRNSLPPAVTPRSWRRYRARSGPTFSHIAGEVGQRIDHALDVLIRTGFVGKDLPVGAPRGARATYETTGPLPALLRSRCPVRRRRSSKADRATRCRNGCCRGGRRTVGLVFEEQARAHARRLACSGASFPPTWSSDGGGPGAARA